MDTSLDTAVRNALIRRKGEWQAIAREADVSYSWLSKFANGKMPNPSYSALKRLHAHLTAPRGRKVAA